VRKILSTDSELQSADSEGGTLRNDADTTCGHHVEIPGTGGVLEERDVVTAIAHEPRPTPPGRPWIMANMASSADGAAAGLEGRSASVSGPADRLLFAALRSIADVILAGAGTIRAENYGAPRLAPGADAQRAARGQAPLPRLAVVTGSLRLDPGARLFHEAQPDSRPLVLTTERALATAGATQRQLAAVAKVRTVGDATVDWTRAVRLLYEEYEAGTVLVEGGPTVNAQLAEHDLFDELCLTVAPLLLGGGAQRIVASLPPLTPLTLRLDRVFEDEGFLFLRYLRRR
jgi:riboflavin-specific deaminase-like protein